MAALLTLDDFRPALRETFTLALDGGASLALVLEEARPIGEGRFSEREPFALLFRGPPDPPLPQATYRLGHDGLGELEIFIVPVAATRDGRDYEAIFT